MRTKKQRHDQETTKGGKRKTGQMNPPLRFFYQKVLLIQKH